jgi:phosphoribosyl-ATP pyrophosphohydrolase/phosphoribosyl-AMP cyclohydrolase
METKNIVATLYLKDGNAVKSMDDFTIIGDVYEICQVYNDS